MWGGKIPFKTPMLFCIGFLFQFLIAGLTGIMLGAAPFDWQLSNSYFVVAHFHYVIVGGILFALFGAFYYWYPKDVGEDVQRNPGQMALLAVPHRISSDLRLHAHSRVAGHAAENLYLRTRPRLGHLESDRHRRSCVSGVGHSGLRLQPGVVVLPRQDCRERSMGRVDSGMVHQFAAAGLQLRRDPNGSEAAARCGISSIRTIRTGNTNRRNCRECHVDDRIRRHQRWVLPARGPVAMFCLIAAESAIFTIFVVAYLFYIGKSLTGPAAEGCARSADLLQHLPAFQQPDDSLGGESPSQGKQREFRSLVVRNHCARAPLFFMGRPANGTG